VSGSVLSTVLSLNDLGYRGPPKGVGKNAGAVVLDVDQCSLLQAGLARRTNIATSLTLKIDVANRRRKLGEVEGWRFGLGAA